MCDFIRGSQLSTVKTDRCGVIPYTIIDNEVHFLFAEYSKSKELCDFGGGIRKTESSLTGGFREFLEESRSIFSDISSPNDLSHSVAIIDKRRLMALIFVYIDPAWYSTARTVFHSTSKVDLKKSSLEIEDIRWVKMTELAKLLWSDEMWERLRKFLRPVDRERLFSFLKYSANSNNAESG